MASPSTVENEASTMDLNNVLDQHYKDNDVINGADKLLVQSNYYDMDELPDLFKINTYYKYFTLHLNIRSLVNLKLRIWDGP